MSLELDEIEEMKHEAELDGDIPEPKYIDPEKVNAPSAKADDDDITGDEEEPNAPDSDDDDYVEYEDDVEGSEDDDEADEEPDDDPSDSYDQQEQLYRAYELGVSRDRAMALAKLGPEAMAQALDTIEELGGARGHRDSDDDPDNGDENQFLRPKKLDLGIPEDELDESVSGAFNKLNDGLADITGKLYDQLDVVADYAWNESNSRMRAEVNEYIDELADSNLGNFKKSLGAGTDGLVEKGSIAHKNRERVEAEIKKIQNERMKRGQPLMTTKRAFNEAVAKVTGVNPSKKAQANRDTLSKARRSASPSRSRTTNKGANYSNMTEDEVLKQAARELDLKMRS